jgi:hypothetical protein
MLRKMKAWFTVFKKGKEITEAAKWKNRQIAGNILLSLFSAFIVIAEGYGYYIELDEQTLEALAYGIASLYAVSNAVLTAITSKKVGVGHEGDADSVGHSRFENSGNRSLDSREEYYDES